MKEHHEPDRILRPMAAARMLGVGKTKFYDLAKTENFPRALVLGARTCGPVDDLPPTERLVLLVLSHHHNDKTGDCFPSTETMAQNSGVTSRRMEQSTRKQAVLLANRKLTPIGAVGEKSGSANFSPTALE